MAPRFRASATCSSILVATPSLLSGPSVVSGVERVAEAQRSSGVLEPGHELVVDRLLDQDPLAGGAALAGAQVAADDRAFDRAVDVGVGEDHHRAVAAELEHHVLAGRASRDRCAGLGRADEADAVDQRVAGDLVADLGAGPVTRLTAPAGKSASAMHSISATEMTLVDVAGRPDDGVARRPAPAR